MPTPKKKKRKTESIETKKCARCRKTLPVDNFYSDRHSRIGFQSYCKKCYAEYHVERKSKISAPQLDYYNKLDCVSCRSMACEACEKGRKFIDME